MKFFSGFGFYNESTSFAKWINYNERFCAVGFSMGAIDAFEYALSGASRIDRLILLSPSYFCDVSDAKKAQEIETFSAHQEVWFKFFYSKCGMQKSMQNRDSATKENLYKLLYYDWDVQKFEFLNKKGIEIDVYFGEKDKIINVKSALNYFKPLVCQTFLIKNVGHALN